MIAPGPAGRGRAEPSIGSALDPDRRAALLGSSLVALARPHAGGAQLETEPFPGGAAAVARTAARGAVDAAWVFLDEQPVRSLGAALVWAGRRGARAVHVAARSDADVVARRAALFDPAPTTWWVDGDQLVPAPAAAPPVSLPAPASHLDGLLVDAGLEVVVEDGVLRGELNGLEVARVVHGFATDGTPLDEPRLEVGVGKADREMTALVHAGLSPARQLDRVIEIVRAHRRPGAAPHPLNGMVPERWLRARLVAHPERVGLSQLRPIEAAVPRRNLREPGIAAALGTSSDGDPVVLACSVGVDLDLVPSAADTRAAVAPSAALRLAVPERDHHPITRDLAARLASPAEVVPIPGDWTG